MNPNAPKETKEAVLGCLNIADDEAAFLCLQETILRLSREEGACVPRIVLFTREGCDACAEEKQTLGDKISQGLIKEVNVDTALGQELARKAEIRYVPDIAIFDCEDRVIQP